MSISIFIFISKRVGQKPVAVNRLFFVFDENFVLTFLAHTADVVFLDAERVAEDVGTFAAGDAGATSNRERPSATEIAEAEIVESHRHVFCFHREQTI